MLVLLGEVTYKISDPYDHSFWYIQVLQESILRVKGKDDTSIIRNRTKSYNSSLYTANYTYMKDPFLILVMDTLAKNCTPDEGLPGKGNAVEN